MKKPKFLTRLLSAALCLTMLTQAAAVSDVHAGLFDFPAQDPEMQLFEDEEDFIEYYFWNGYVDSLKVTGYYLEDDIKKHSCMLDESKAYIAGKFGFSTKHWYGYKKSDFGDAFEEPWFGWSGCFYLRAYYTGAGGGVGYVDSDPIFFSKDKKLKQPTVTVDKYNNININNADPNTTGFKGVFSDYTGGYTSWDSWRMLVGDVEDTYSFTGNQYNLGYNLTKGKEYSLSLRAVDSTHNYICSKPLLYTFSPALWEDLSVTGLASGDYGGYILAGTEFSDIEFAAPPEDTGVTFEDYRWTETFSGTPAPETADPLVSYTCEVTVNSTEGLLHESTVFPLPDGLGFQSLKAENEDETKFTLTFTATSGYNTIDSLGFDITDGAIKSGKLNYGLNLSDVRMSKTNPDEHFTILDTNWSCVSHVTDDLSVMPNGTYMAKIVVMPEKNYRVSLDKDITLPNGFELVSAAYENDFYIIRAKIDTWDLEKYELKYDLCGGRASEASQAVTVGQKPYKPETPKYNGHIFQGWYLDPEYTTPFDFDEPMTQDTTIYAKWREARVVLDNHVVTLYYNYSGKQYTASVSSVTPGAVFEQPANPTQSGLNFVGWYSDEFFQNEYDFSQPVTSDLSLYAKWSTPRNVVCRHTTLVEVKEKEPGCTEYGHIGYYYCSNCSKRFADASASPLPTEGLMTPAIGHKMGEFTSNGDATCEADGTKTSRCTNNGCKYNITEPDYGSFKPHVPISANNAQPGSCLTDKVGSDTICKNCGTLVSKGSVLVPAPGHSFTKYTSDNNATCSSDGTKTAKCDDCNAISTIVDEDSKLPHTKSKQLYGDMNEHYYRCTVCGETVDAKAHTDANNDTNCDVCGQKIHEHSLTYIPRTESTCSVQGIKAFYLCNCGKWFEDKDAIKEITDQEAHKLPIKEHTYPDNKYTTDEYGNYYHTCTVCGQEDLASYSTVVNIECPEDMTEEITAQLIRKSDGKVEKQEVVTPSNGLAQFAANGLMEDYLVTFTSATYTAKSISLTKDDNTNFKTVTAKMAPCPVVASASLTLDGTIGVNIKVEVPDEFDVCQALIYYTGNTTATKRIRVSSRTKDSNGRYVFTFPVAAKEIADKVSFELYDPNNQKMKIVKGTSKKAIDNNCFQYAAMDYINSKKSSSDTQLASLCKTLSDFGNASRIMFNYNATGAKIEQSLSGVTAATLKPYELVRDEACVDGIKISSASLIIESETTINIKFKTTKSSISGYTFTCDGKKVTPTKIGEGEYQVQVTNISAADLDKAHTFSVSDGKNTQKITYSALSYAYSKISSTDTKLSNLVKTLYLYNKAAKTYLGR